MHLLKSLLFAATALVAIAPLAGCVTNETNARLAAGATAPASEDVAGEPIPAEVAAATPLPMIRPSNLQALAVAYADATPASKATEIIAAGSRSGCSGRASDGRASYYATKFHGRRTASGETFDMHAMTAAHRSLPFGTRVRVTDLHSCRSVVVRINDRGPFAKGRVIDLSYAAANELGFRRRGTTAVDIERLN